ncbi:MAG: RNA polymerase sigma factor [bacterium]|nr:RNA polymerase sigma factor [bacterium]
MMEVNLNTLAKEAQNGSKESLEKLLSHIQGFIYNLAIRMLKTPFEAEDATQDILIRIMTHLGQFRGESAFLTWAYRIATTTLINRYNRDTHKTQISFDHISQQLETSLALSDSSAEDVYEDITLVEEVRRSCTLGMLMCLNHEDRLALVLGELIGISSDDASYIMGISAPAYRKRLSRARQALVAFVSHRCGIINTENPCKCHKHVQNKIRIGMMTPDSLVYNTPHSADSCTALEQANLVELEQATRTMALFRAHPEYASNTNFAEMIRQMFISPDQDRL